MTGEGPTRVAGHRLDQVVGRASAGSGDCRGAPCTFYFASGTWRFSPGWAAPSCFPGLLAVRCHVDLGSAQPAVVQGARDQGARAAQRRQGAQIVGAPHAAGGIEPLARRQPAQRPQPVQVRAAAAADTRQRHRDHPLRPALRRLEQRGGTQAAARPGSRARGPAAARRRTGRAAAGRPGSRCRGRDRRARPRGTGGSRTRPRSRHRPTAAAAGNACRSSKIWALWSPCFRIASRSAM